MSVGIEEINGLRAEIGRLNEELLTAQEKADAKTHAWAEHIQNVEVECAKLRAKNESLCMVLAKQEMAIEALKKFVTACEGLKAALDELNRP
jgi:SMC interacting uncharacterized protein involved in chromosome segregation